MEISYFFLKESFSYISGKGNPGKISYILGNIFFILQETETTKKSPYISGKRAFLYFRRNSKAPKTKIYYTSPKNVLSSRFQNFFRIIVSIFSIS